MMMMMILESIAFGARKSAPRAGWTWPFVKRDLTRTGGRD